MTKKQVGIRLSEGARFLADKIGFRMGNFDRTTVLELAIRELAQSEIKRGRLTLEDMDEYQRIQEAERQTMTINIAQEISTDTLVAIDKAIEQGRAKNRREYLEALVRRDLGEEL